MTAPSAPIGARRRACAAGITRLSSTSHRNWKVFAASHPRSRHFRTRRKRTSSHTIKRQILKRTK